MRTNNVNLSMLGNKDIWKLPKTAFLSSDKFSAASVLKSYDFAKEMTKEGRCVISGFKSRLEKDVLNILLNGSSPIIWALARGLVDKPPKRLIPAFEEGRLLIVSIFDKAIARENRRLAHTRNQFIVDLAERVVFARIRKGGMLEKLILPDSKETLVLDRF